MSKSYDVIVIGGGVVGASVAFHLTRLGAGSVLLIERNGICSGGTAKSCAIIRTHYSIPSNTRIAVASLDYFRNFPDMLDHADASSGFVNSGYLIFAGAGASAEHLRANLAQQAKFGANTYEISREEALERHALLHMDDAALIGFEPDSGYADPYLTTTGFANAARSHGAQLMTNRAVTGLLIEGGRIKGIRTADEEIHAGAVVCAVGPWSHAMARAAGAEIPLEVSRHIVLTFRAEEPYEQTRPIVKDLTTENMMYFRPASGGVVLVGTGDHGEPLRHPDEMDEAVLEDYVALQGRQLSHRMPVFLDAGYADSWVGPYDITPDWNPVLDGIAGIDGLVLAFGFSGHGFKLSPMIGKLLAQKVLGLPRDIDISPYRLSRFAEGDLLTGAYGAGSIS